MSQQHATQLSDPRPICLLAAISLTNVISFQLIEGSVDAVIFENYIHDTLLAIRTDAETRNRHVILIIDNVQLHKADSIKATAKRFNSSVLFLPQYSPFLAGVE